MLKLNHSGVEVFIKRFNKRNQESFWENYNLLIWKKNPSGYTDKKGMFRNNSWGIAETVSVNDKGIWDLPHKYVKYFK
jgi:hypothetical protein